MLISTCIYIFIYILAYIYAEHIYSYMNKYIQHVYMLIYPAHIYPQCLQPPKNIKNKLRILNRLLKSLFRQDLLHFFLFPAPSKKLVLKLNNIALML